MGSPSNRWSIVIVDDNENFLTLTRLAFVRDGRFTVTEQGRNGAEAVALVEAFRPMVVVLDDDMPVMSGLAAIPEIRRVSPATRVVVFSSSVGFRRPTRAIELGAHATASKLNPISALVDCVARLLTADEE